ncbi:MAG: nucleoside recognition domain-containing protein [Clostridiales bacterium]|nr:nucleoside recognition domain-containing protein [Clostridiales bacterium]
MLTYIWIGMIAVSVVYGAASGNIARVGAAALGGAEAAVSLCFSLLAPICLWSGLTELLSSAGALGLLSKMLSPILKRVFPNAHSDGATGLIAANVGANMLGLGNAATPLSVRAAKALGKRCRDNRASNELCRFTVLNTASVQLLPMTVCSVRAGLGAESPFDIVPAVWIASLAALAAGAAAAFIFEKLGRSEKN